MQLRTDGVRLLQKNDSEKQLILMNRAHKSQNEVMHKLQEKADKVKRYEEALRKQEKVIEKLERVANKAPISTYRAIPYARVTTE